jgi:hypothetical protein
MPVPWPVRADLEDAPASVVYEAGGEVPDPVAECVRLGFLQVLAVVEAQLPVSGGEVTRDGGGLAPGGVRGRGQRPPPADSAGLGQVLRSRGPTWNPNGRQSLRPGSCSWC